VIFRQLIHDDLGCASYLVGDEHAGAAAVVDPKLEVDDYLRLARFLGVAIAHVLDTHTHADHVSGHGRLHAAPRATIHVHRDAGVLVADEVRGAAQVIVQELLEQHGSTLPPCSAMYPKAASARLRRPPRARAPRRAAASRSSR